MDSALLITAKTANVLDYYLPVVAMAQCYYSSLSSLLLLKV